MIDFLENNLNLSKNEIEFFRWLMNASKDAKRLGLDDFQQATVAHLFSAHLLELHRRRYIEE
jgi:hypothetical protein